MKPQQSNVTVARQGVQESVTFGIKESGMAHIMGVLRNQLYSDKVLAVIREYACNAVDANVEAGKGDTPITVTLPNRMNPYFKVRDNGLGLSKEDVNDIYAFYGESTKRASNDQIGMLGIGSKAAFAYGDNFVINSYINGKKVMYNAYIDESQRGQISTLGEEDTSEPDGVEIVVPVRDGDHQEFQNKATGLFKWFKVRPEVKGCEAFKYEDKADTLFSGTGWQWLRSDSNSWNRGSANVVMGNIGYPIDQSGLNLTSEDYENYNSLLTDSLVLEMNIGDVEISASREKLQFTEYTRKNIIAKLETVKSELIQVIEAEFGGCKTLFDAKCLLGELFDYGSGLYSLRDALLKSLEFNGEKIGDWQFNASSDNEGFTLSRATKFGYQGKYRMEEKYRMDCAKNVVVIHNDLGHRRSLMGRVYPLVINESKDVYMVEAKGHLKSDGTKVSDKKVLDDWKKKSGFDGKMLTLSKLPLHKLSDFGFAPVAGNGTGDKDVKHSLQCFKPDWARMKDLRRWHTKKADFWEAASADMDKGGYYVIIDKFLPFDVRGVDDPKNLESLKDDLGKVGLQLPEFYAFKLASRNKVEEKSQWKTLDSWIEEQLKNLAADKEQQVFDASFLKKLNDNLGNPSWNPEHIEENRETVLEKVLNNIKTDSVFKEFWDKHDEMKGNVENEKQIKVILSFARAYKIDLVEQGLKPTHDLKALAKKISDKYSMLNQMEASRWGNTWRSTSEEHKQTAEDVANYIMVIDCCEAAKS